MTVVFVHGVPETAAVWDEVRARLDQDSVALALPGFGCPLPAGFDAKEDWEAWLVEELRRLPGPIDLIGHDWGSMLSLRIAVAHGELLRSWAVDIAAVSHPDYTWHDFATQLWMTPGAAQQWMRDTLAHPEEFFGQLAGLGLTAAQAEAMGAEFDPAMAAAMLALYGSARPNVHADWTWPHPPPAPGTILRPTADPFDDETLALDTARRLGAGIVEMPGRGHFWMLEDPGQSASLLRSWLVDR